jgi:hypothetical protein
MLYRNLSGGMQKTSQILSQSGKFEDRRANPGPPEHEAATVLTWPDSRSLNHHQRTFWRCIQVTGYSDAISKWPDILTLYPSDRTFWRCIQVTGHSDRMLCHCRSDILTLPTSQDSLIQHPHDRIFWPLTTWPDILHLFGALDRTRPR